MGLAKHGVADSPRREGRLGTAKRRALRVVVEWVLMWGSFQWDAEGGVNGASHGLDMFKGNIWGDFDGLEACRGDVNHGEIGVDSVHDALAGQRVGARLDEFGLAVFWWCAENEDGLDPGHQIPSPHPRRELRQVDRWTNWPNLQIERSAWLRGCSSPDVHRGSSRSCRRGGSVRARDRRHARLPALINSGSS